jgi:hypothetical protein
MMKIALRHPSGLEIEFEGDEEAFKSFVHFLGSGVQPFVQGLESRSEQDRAQDQDGASDTDDGGDENGEDAFDGNALDPRTLAVRMEKVGAKTDIERVTVMAQAAVDAGRDGLDSKLADSLYDQLGFPKPSRWSKAFSNAKARGLVRSPKYGFWAPTVHGENYAKHGTKPPPRRRRSGAGPGGNGRDDALELEPGTEGQGS